MCYRDHLKSEISILIEYVINVILRCTFRVVMPARPKAIHVHSNLRGMFITLVLISTVYYYFSSGQLSNVP